MRRVLFATLVSTVLVAAGSCGGAGNTGGGGTEHTGTSGLGGESTSTHDAAGGATTEAGPDATATDDGGDAAPDVVVVEVDTGVPDAAEDAPAPPDPHVCPSPDPLDCSPGSGTGNADQCHDAPSCFLKTIQAAVNAVLTDHPDWFTPEPNHSNCPFIVDGHLDDFMDTVVANIEAAGLCAIRDPNAPGEEITIKHDNAYSENFDIVASWGCARYGSGIYTGYCAPAWW